ncbi:MAG TPA: hemerythrin domain-containing protein [Trebonia sp.]|nr:hemerythrin domain-containing protein [Trebonia sp.]
MADILQLLTASRYHIQLARSRLRKLTGQPLAGSGAFPVISAIHSAWNDLATLIDWHMAAEDEICRIPAAGSSPAGGAGATDALERHDDIRDALRAARLQPPGSPRWRHMTAQALSAWSRDDSGPALAAELRRLAPDRRSQLARHWRAYMEARTRDAIPAPAGIPACRLAHCHPDADVPHPVDPSFSPLYCTCRDCDDILRQHTARHQAPGM